MAALLSNFSRFVRLTPTVIDALLARGYTSTIVKARTTLQCSNEAPRGVLIGPCYFLNFDRMSMLEFVDHDDDDGGDIGIEAIVGRRRYMSTSTRENFANYAGRREAHWTSSL